MLPPHLYNKNNLVAMLPRLELGIFGLKGRCVDQFHYSTIHNFVSCLPIKIGSQQIKKGKNE